ncbi:hypothetical protein PILCRDRAFT_818173 [Piloderma croceum F 1598]|uniref:Methyltransferase type 11 domain-containing protein n=1 Tax=Piloderma croceum (strain F 1598) TaxID=765440 RepID=A0A0C3G208_PILCF|nr:hypothetical protein PILCRDRAFT_818173 [Piloderma croceum F 1598]
MPKRSCSSAVEAMVQSVQQRIIESEWKGTKAKVMDAQKTGFPDGSFIHVLTNFGVMLMPDPTAVLNKCFRVLKPGGKYGVTTWTTAGWTPDVQEAFVTITGAPLFSEDEIFMGFFGDGKPWYRAEYVKRKLEDRGWMSCLFHH